MKNIGDMASLHTKIIKLILDWLHSEKVCYQALTLMTTIVQNSARSKDGGGDKDIMELLLTKVQTFLGMLQSNALATDIEPCKRLESLLELLR